MSKTRRPLATPPSLPVHPAPAIRPVAQQAPVPAVFGSDAAPVIYFDGVIAFGIRDGVVQLELATNQLVPVTLEGTKVKTKVVVVAHLRCTVSTIDNLVEVIEKIVTTPSPMTKQ